jgi:hypothetical protein
MEALTVAQLMRVCQQAIRDGYGNKHILISDDDEGNGYHELFYGICTIEEEEINALYNMQMIPCGMTKEELKNYVTLG